MTDTELRSSLLKITALSNEYCTLLQNVAEIERPELLRSLLNLLPRIYVEFLDLAPETVSLEENDEYFAEYVDEDYYESIRRSLENVLAPDDTYLETFEEDMKYSDTPIGASISESLADIFQPLYNFVSAVRDSEGERMQEAYTACRDNFAAYWAQTLCNVLRPINHLYFA